jgi:hypothetical protein
MTAAKWLLEPQCYFYRPSPEIKRPYAISPLYWSVVAGLDLRCHDVLLLPVCPATCCGKAFLHGEPKRSLPKAGDSWRAPQQSRMFLSRGPAVHRLSPPRRRRAMDGTDNDLAPGQNSTEYHSSKFTTHHRVNLVQANSLSSEYDMSSSAQVR